MLYMGAVGGPKNPLAGSLDLQSCHGPLGPDSHILNYANVSSRSTPQMIQLLVKDGGRERSEYMIKFPRRRD